MKLLQKTLLVASIAIGFVSEARAVAITTLFNTGVNSSGAVLPDGTIGDPHYTLVSVPSGPTAIRIKTSASGFPVPPWIGDSPVSTWIGPNSDASLDGPPGPYTYRTTFSLAGLNPATASISGRWSTDNSGTSMLLNGVATGNTAGGFESFFSFSISSGFISGVNTLDFIVDNGGGPTGLRVEMTGTASALSTGVPDSGSTLLLLGTMLPALEVLRRRMS